MAGCVTTTDSNGQSSCYALGSPLKTRLLGDTQFVASPLNFKGMQRKQRCETPEPGEHTEHETKKTPHEAAFFPAGDSSAHTNRIPLLNGTCRTGLPVAAKIAFSTAGTTTQMVGSPTPPQKS